MAKIKTTYIYDDEKDVVTITSLEKLSESCQELLEELEELKKEKECACEVLQRLIDKLDGKENNLFLN